MCCFLSHCKLLNGLRFNSLTLRRLFKENYFGEMGVYIDVHFRAVNQDLFFLNV